MSQLLYQDIHLTYHSFHLKTNKQTKKHNEITFEILLLEFCKYYLGYQSVRITHWPIPTTFTTSEVHFLSYQRTVSVKEV